MTNCREFSGFKLQQVRSLDMLWLCSLLRVSPGWNSHVSQGLQSSSGVQGILPSSLDVVAIGLRTATCWPGTAFSSQSHPHSMPHGPQWHPHVEVFFQISWSALLCNQPGKRLVFRPHLIRSGQPRVIFLWLHNVAQSWECYLIIFTSSIQTFSLSHQITEIMPVDFDDYWDKNPKSKNEWQLTYVPQHPKPS